MKLGRLIAPSFKVFDYLAERRAIAASRPRSPSAERSLSVPPRLYLRFSGSLPSTAFGAPGHHTTGYLAGGDALGFRSPAEMELGRLARISPPVGRSGLKAAWQASQESTIRPLAATRAVRSRA